MPLSARETAWAVLRTGQDKLLSTIKDDLIVTTLVELRFSISFITKMRILFI
jgi:hypothetical protein